jgi:tetratricopeptide (TPR) repeat protein
MNAMEPLYQQYPNDDEVKAFYALSVLSGARALDDDSFRYEMKAGAMALDVFKRNPEHPGAVHYAIHAFDDPVHAPLALEAAHAYAEIVPAVSHAVHMPTHIFIQHGMWNYVANQNVRAFNVGKDLWQPGDSPGDMAHSGDWGQYGFLQLGDYAGARERIQALEEMRAKTEHARAASVVALAHARYIIETEDWKVKSIDDNASTEAILANGMSAVHLGDMAVAEQMLAKLAAKAGSPASGTSAGGAHADHGATPPASAPNTAESAKAPRIMHKELAALIALKNGQKDEAVSLLKEAVQIEESMRPPNGAADPVKPSRELLGEVLLEVGKPAEAAEAFDASLLRMPNRARSLMGAARAHAGAGNAALADARYKTLMSFWKGPSIARPTTTEAR